MKTANSLVPLAPSHLSLVPSAPPVEVTAQDVTDYLPLVHQMVARRLRRLPPNVLRDDLIAAGTYGLMQALRRNGHDRTPTFEGYVRIRINGAIVDELRSQDWLSRRERSRLARASDGPAPCAGVMSIEDLSDTQLENLHENGPSAHDRVEKSAARAAIVRAMGCLTEREQRLLVLYYFHAVELKDIAEEFGVGASRVSQLHSQALAKLKIALSEATPESDAA
jgi:RNA polymerase sigma factor for flagellar operon FliA